MEKEEDAPTKEKEAKKKGKVQIVLCLEHLRF
jgi:hypothetical protein